MPSPLTVVARRVSRRVGGMRDGWRAFAPPPPSPDGTMSLYDHLRELRYRVVLSVLAVAVCMIASAFFYQTVIEQVVFWPWNSAIAEYRIANPDAKTDLYNPGVTSPLMLALKTTLLTGLIAASPIWLYQLWAFIVPALLEREKRYAMRFVAAAIPLFLAGCAIGYFILPRGFSFMLQFTVPGVLNLQDVNDFLNLEMTLVLLFGVSFLLPVVLVMLNIIGIITGAQLSSSRKFAIFGCFLFGAIATPTGDPFSMTALAAPMAIMYVVAEIICRRHDAGKAKRLASDDLAVSID